MVKRLHLFQGLHCVWLIVLVLMVSLIPFRSTSAQSEVTFDSLEVQLWPEFDRPEMLVIFKIKISRETPLPANLSLRIPREAGEPFSVAMQDVDGMLYNLDYTTTVEDNWLRIDFLAKTSVVQLEYYDPRLLHRGSWRRFDFVWHGDYAVKSMAVHLKQLLRSEGLDATPEGFHAGPANSEGLVYYTAIVGEAPAGQLVSISINYEKPDSQSDLNLYPVQSSQPLHQSLAIQTALSEKLPWALGLLGLTLILAAAVGFWQSGRAKPKSGEKP
jgi:hypothetical protein